MHQYSDRFIHSRFAVMRHAKDIEKGKEVSLDELSVGICRRVIHELGGQINGFTVGIRHSPLRRAELTAHVAHQELIENGITVSCVEPCKWLNCNSYGLRNENVQGLPDDPTIFWLLITHLPDIERFLGEECRPANCTLVAKEFLISGRQFLVS